MYVLKLTPKAAPSGRLWASACFLELGHVGSNHRSSEELEARQFRRVGAVVVLNKNLGHLCTGEKNEGMRRKEQRHCGFCAFRYPQGSSASNLVNESLKNFQPLPLHLPFIEVQHKKLQMHPTERLETR